MIDDGLWATTLQRPDVTLCTDSIASITTEGLITEDGTFHDVDAIIYGTGFKASEFLTPMKIVGKGGVSLHEQCSSLFRDCESELPQLVLPIWPEHKYRDKWKHNLFL